MDKISQNGAGSRSAWSRVQSPGGHRSSVDGAIRAHRQRVSERNLRTEERVFGAMSEPLSRQYNPAEVLMSQSSNQMGVNPLLNTPRQTPESEVTSVMPESQVEQSTLPIARPQSNFQPRMIDEIYGEAQMGSITERALGLVNKEISAPEQQTSDEVPKGSYVDYTV